MRTRAEGPILFEQGRLKMEVRSFHLIALFTRDFLRIENLRERRTIERWLRALERIKPGSWGKWADMTRRAILDETVPAACAVLGRPLSESETLFLSVRVHGFIELYAMTLMKNL